MNSLSASSINAFSPYFVIAKSETEFYFDTDLGIGYEVGFIEDDMIVENGVFQIFVRALSCENPPFDDKVRLTITAILEVFFSVNNDAIIYICDTRDNRQAARDRKFRIWFAAYASQRNYYFHNYEFEVEGEYFFASIILRKDHPDCDTLLGQFDGFAADLRDKQV